MQHRNLFVFDIETIPDTDSVEALTGFTEPGVEARRAELERYHLDVTDGRNAFLRQPFHKVVAIAFLETEIDRDGNHESYLLKELRAGGDEDWDEKRLIEGFFAYFERIHPRLVSYNGRTFDLPVLRYRAMMHGISTPYLYGSGDKWNSYTSRYSPDWHCDLLEVLSDYGAAARVRLNEVCAVLGLPGKFGPSGADVAGMYDEGRLGEIRAYCETDVLNTYLVYLRHQLHTGGMDLESHNRAVADLVTMLESERSERPHLGDFLAAWHDAAHGKLMI